MGLSDPISRLLREGVQSGVFPGAVLFVRHQGKIRFHQAIGHTSSLLYAPSVQVDTIYDLASLTKPLATASSLLLLVQSERVSLTKTLATILEETKDVPLGQVTLSDLLSHQSGLPAWKPFYQAFPPAIESESEFRQHHVQVVLEQILKEPIDRTSSSTSVYSDLGYMLLGFVVERVTGRSLATFTQDKIFEPLQASALTFGIQDRKDEADLKNIAPTEEDSWRGRLLHGEVHDENAAALGGVAGHAGLFGTAQAVGQVTQSWLDSYTGKPSVFQGDVFRQFVKAQPGTSWGLGWDTPSKPSSSGQWLSPESFGHLGFTGTSIWIDPIRELEVIFLSNRVHPTRENNLIRKVRPAVADAVVRALENN